MILFTEVCLSSISLSHICLRYSERHYILLYRSVVIIGRLPMSLTPPLWTVKNNRWLQTRDGRLQCTRNAASLYQNRTILCVINEQRNANGRKGFSILLDDVKVSPSITISLVIRNSNFDRQGCAIIMAITYCSLQLKHISFTSLKCNRFHSELIENVFW